MSDPSAVELLPRERRDVGIHVAGGSVDNGQPVLAHRASTIAVAHAELRRPTMEAATVYRGAVDPFELPGPILERSDVEDGVRAMHPIGDHRSWHVRWEPVGEQPEPQVPLLARAEPFVEPSVSAERLAVDHDVGRARRDRVEPRKGRRDGRGIGGRNPVDHVQTRVDVDRPGVDPATTRGAYRLHLHCKLVRRPQIVVVDERDPPPSGGRGPRVPGSVRATPGSVADHANARVVRAKRPLDRVDRGIVDDDYLDVEVALREDARERLTEQAVPVPCRDHDGYVHARHCAAVAASRQDTAIKDRSPGHRRDQGGERVRSRTRPRRVPSPSLPRR